MGISTFEVFQLKSASISDKSESKVYDYVQQHYQGHFNQFMFDNEDDGVILANFA